MGDRCFWCNTDPDEAAARHEGPHATWCLRYRRPHRPTTLDASPPDPREHFNTHKSEGKD
jgi:hypothetical protein